MDGSTTTRLARITTAVPVAQADLDNLLSELGEVLGETGGTIAERAFGGWGGMYAPMPTGSGWSGIPVQPERGASSWPYRTQSAHVVWNKIKEIAPMLTHVTDKELMSRAIEQAGIPAMQLTPEDWRMLEMAVEWYRNGTQYIKPPRIGGAPGGPANFYRDGHTMKARGAP